MTPPAERHDDVRAWWIGARADQPERLTGLALSGGGIRSAIFSLGLIQALARRERLASIDVMSTVSGGGYIGCFLRSLFMPARWRGIAPKALAPPHAGPPPAPTRKEIEDQRRFAMRALASDADQTEIAHPSEDVPIRNPIWWLREHSRYLAPNGPADYGYAAAYLSRNWVAMIFVFAVGAALLLAASAGVQAGLRQAMGTDLYHWTAAQAEARLGAHGPGAAPAAPPPPCLAHLKADVPVTLRLACPAPAAMPRRPLASLVSPLIGLSVLPFLLSLGFAAAYWLTAQMSVNEAAPARQRRNFLKVVGWVAVAGIAVPLALLGHGAVLRRAGLSSGGLSLSAGLRVILWSALVLVALELALGLAYWAWLTWRRSGELLTAEMRRLLTSAKASCDVLGWTMVLVGGIESLGAGLRGWAIDHVRDLPDAAARAVLLPLGAFLLKKLPDWIGGRGGRTMASVRRFLPAIAFAAGVLLYGAAAVFASAAVHAATWTGASWTGPVDWVSWCVVSAGLLLLALLIGRSSGFINLSSWHNLYASRLIRAFLGASNVDRLRSLVDTQRADYTIRENHALDYIQPEVYGQLALPAPLHLINTTLNETVDLRSQLVARDRKGLLVSMQPDGVAIDRQLLPWSDIGGPRKPQAISLGQWCAISGAAASTGMGRLTNLGFALAMSFANVRLGYWWLAPDKPPAASDHAEEQAAASRSKVPGVMPPRRAPVERWWVRQRRRTARGVALLFETFVYLANEMTARYSRTYDRKYLSDGGHFENLGVYPLIRRRVPLIVAADNGQDPDYAFADLENLVRLVRLDLGGETTLLKGGALDQFRGQIGCAAADVFVDAFGRDDWKAALKDGKLRGFALALRIDLPESDDGPDRLHLVLVKPRLLPGLPEDLAGYARANPAFPQQSTGDQFFDEAQWESYRKLGELIGLRLLAACPLLLREVAA